MSGPTFSVVIPAYNSRGTIGATIESVLAQTAADFEVVVVDDGSTDETSAFVRERYPDPRVGVLEQANQGTAGARNAGVTAARGSLVAFLDHDDLWMPTYLAAVGEALEAEPDAGFAFVNAWLLDNERGMVRRRTSWEHYNHVPADATNVEQLAGVIERNFIMSSTTVRAAVLAEMGGFSTEIQGADDWDLWIRILLAGHRAVGVREPQILQRDHAASQSKNLAMMFANMDTVLERAIGAKEMPADVREVAQRVRKETARLHAREGSDPRARLERAARDARVRWRESRRLTGTWFDRPPAEIAAAFPRIAAGYGRPHPDGEAAGPGARLTRAN